MDAALHSVDGGADVSSWARPGPGMQYVICVMALAVKIGYRAASSSSECHFIAVRDGYYCRAQGLSFISSKVISVGFPALSLWLQG